MKKKLVSMLLTLPILLSLLPAATIGAAAEEVTLPAGYTQVEYIQSDGSGYIDTGWASASANTSYTYEVTYSTQTPFANGTVIGAFDSVNNNPYNERMGILGVRSKGTTRVGFGLTSVGTVAAYVPYFPTVKDQPETVTVSVDVTANTYAVTRAAGSFTNATGTIQGTPLCDMNTYIFANNTGLTANERLAAKLYGLKIWQDEKLVRDYIPCVNNTTGVAGIYDLVGQNFQTASSNGAGISSPASVPETTVTFTTPSDVFLTVSKGFADGGEVVTKLSEETADGITTHTYVLPVGSYRFLSMGEDSIANQCIIKYYNWDKNFIVTDADVLNGGKTIDADPGLLANTGWEQKRFSSAYYVREFTDELLGSDTIQLSDKLKAQYAEVFTTPTFTNTSKARHEFTTQAEMEAFVADLVSSNSNMYSYMLGKSKDNDFNIIAALFTMTDVSGKTLEEAAELVRANGKPTVEIQAQVHGNEHSGTEGALAAMKLLCGSYGESILQDLNILILPRVNVDGSMIYRYEARAGARNINRDYLSLIEPETQCLIHLYNLFMPEVVTDQHEFRPAVGSTQTYIPDVSIGIGDNLNVSEDLFALQYDYLDYEFDTLQEDGMRINFYRDNNTNTSPTTAKEYYTMRGSVSLLHEIPGQRRGRMHWERRILAHVLSIKNTLDYTATHADEVKMIVADARADIVAKGTNYSDDKCVVLDHATGTTPFSWNRPIYDLRDGTLVKAVNMATYYKYDVASKTRPYPLAYVVAKDAQNIDRVLSIAEMHNIAYKELAADEQMDLRQYSGNGASATLGETELKCFENGAYVFYTAQESGLILAMLMEPDNLDAREDESNPHKASFVQQGILSASDIYRCESLNVHELTLTPADTARLFTLKRGDTITLAAGSTLLWNAGNAQAQAGLVDTTAGSDLPSGGQVTVDHHYLNALEEGPVTVTVRSDAAQLLVQGRWVMTESNEEVTAFTDLVQDDDWFYDAVYYAVDRSLFNGVSATEFSPSATMNRAMLATVLHRLSGSPQVSCDGMFSDVPSSQWYASGISWAAQAGVVNGLGGGLFGPANDVTREQIATMLWRYAGEPGTNGGLFFRDADQTSSYALTAMCWAVEHGIINGKGDGILDPKGLATRAQVAQMLKNYLDN